MFIKKDLLIPLVLKNWARKEKVHWHPDLSRKVVLLTPQLNLSRKGFRSLLFSAVKMKDLSLLKLLIRLGVELDIKDFWGNTALLYAIDRRYPRAAKLLIENGACVKAKDPSKNSALHLAASRGYVEVARLLIERGANVNGKGSHRHTPLHNAYTKKIAQLLIEKGANVNAKDEFQNTPLDSMIFFANKDARIFIEQHGGKKKPSSLCLVM